MCLQRAQNVARQRGLRRAAVPQRKVTAFIFLVTFFFLLVALRLVERRLHLRIRSQSQRALPLRNSLIHLVHSVVRPAFQLRDVGVVWSDAPRTLKIIQRLLVFASP